MSPLTTQYLVSDMTSGMAQCTALASVLGLTFLSDEMTPNKVQSRTLLAIDVAKCHPPGMLTLFILECHHLFLS